ELNDLFDMGVRFEISNAQMLIAHFQVKPKLIDKIGVAHDRDPDLVKIKEEVQIGNSPGFQIVDGILKHGNRLCMLNVDGLKQKILKEAHYAPYNVYLGATKMYHDMEGMYWWFGMKKDMLNMLPHA